MGFEWGARGVRGRTGSLRTWQMRSGTDEDVIDAVFRRSGARTGRALPGCAKQGGKAVPVAWSRQADRPNTAGVETGRRHDVSRSGGRVVMPSIVLMMIIRPWRQTGHCVRESPVSSSQRSR